LELHKKVNDVIELVKGDYLVLTLPKHKSPLDFALTRDFNMCMDSHKHFTTGQRLMLQSKYCQMLLHMGDYCFYFSILVM